MTTDNRPPYERIASHYREKIATGELQPGQLLPSIKTVAGEWGVSAATAEKALAKLRAEGLVRGIHGVGTEVTAKASPLSSGSQRATRGNRTGSSWREGERSDSHQAALVPAPDDVAAALGIRPGDQVIKRTRYYRDSHGIVAHSTSWIPAEFGQSVPELLENSRLTGGTSLDLITRASGREVESRFDELDTRIATAADMELLELEPGTVAAILVLRARFLDAQGATLEYGVDVGAPGRTWIAENDV